MTIDEDKQLWRTGSINPRCANFFCLWLVMWSNPKYRNSNARKSAESKKKPVVFSRKQRVLWSCYPDLNWGPHPYQLIAHPRNASIWRFGGVFVPENRRQWCFPLHCLHPLVSCCGSGCGSRRKSKYTSEWGTPSRVTPILRHCKQNRGGQL